MTWEENSCRDYHAILYPTETESWRTTFCRSFLSHFGSNKSYCTTLCYSAVVDVYGIVVKNEMLINGDYQHMHANIQSLIADTFKRKLRYGLFLQNMIHDLVPADILKQYYDQYSMNEFALPDIMTYDHHHRDRSRRMVLRIWTLEVKSMRVDSRMNKCNPPPR